MMPRPRILFVDDDSNVTANLKLVLRKQPWEVVTANSGRAGLEMLRQQPFDVVVSDERMPEMSGAEFLTRVAAESSDSVRIVLSGEASLEATIRAINDAGIFRFLTKPCDTKDLISCIEAALKASHDARAARKLASGPEVSDDAVRALPGALDGLTLVFQPIIDGRSRNLFGYEALVRSAHPSLPHPGLLFDAAEVLGCELEVEAIIRERVAAALVELPSNATLFVNLHPNTLGDAEFFEEGNPLFRAADRIVLEITERGSLEEIDDVQGRIAALRDRGFRIAIDDLGAGYSGLNSFSQLNPDIVKLDIELIREIDQSETNQRIIESMVRLGRELNFSLVAEGIERPAELETILALECDLLQGFLLARPAKGFTEWTWGLDDRS